MPSVGNGLAPVNGKERNDQFPNSSLLQLPFLGDRKKTTN